MATKRDPLRRASDQIRADAEAKLAGTPLTVAPGRSAEVLLHELQVHQIELEMQNEALCEAMAALEESRDRYAKRFTELYESAPVGYLTINESGQIDEANLTAATLLGIERNQLRNMRFDHFVATAGLDRWQQLFMSVKKGAKGQTLDVLLQHGGSSEILVHLDCRRDESEALPCTLRIAITDISERYQVERQLRENEALFRAIFDHNLDAVLLAGPDGRVLAANPEAQRMFGYSNEAFCRLGREDVVDTTDPRFEEFLASRDKDGWFRGELTLIGKGGRRFPAELSSSVFIGKDGKRMTSTLVRDISQSMQEAHMLRQAKNEAERANNAKSRFLAAASHDLRQPLSALSIYVDALKNDVTLGARPVLANMKSCIGSLSGLLTDLLDISKLDAGVVKPNFSHFRISDMLDRLVSVNIPEAELKGLRLRVVSSNLTAHTDPVLYQRILGNLIDNAIRYTERGGALVGCRRRCGKIWVEVWDTGIGIPEDKTVEIFEEFKQLGDDARNRGSGLGLAVVAKAAALLGLAIGVRSRRGYGSVFAVELPLGQDRMIPTLEAHEIAERPLRIAFVEDNNFVRLAFVGAFENAGHHVVAAASGEQLRVELGDLPPDIVVCDYRLAQGETGFDVISAVRATMGVNVPAILLTGDTDPKLMRSMADRGIIVLHKPVDLETLKAHLEDLTHQD